MVFFSFAEYWWFYLIFVVFVLVMLALDLGVFHRQAHEISFKEASIWTAVWISLALIFNYGFYLYTGYELSSNPKFANLSGIDQSLYAKTLGLEFLTGFIIEKALAIDNIFIFAVVFSYFGIPKVYQHRVLFWGIIGALVFRAIFIALGSVLMNYHWVILVFGVILILTGIKMMFAGTETQNLENSLLVKLLRKVLPIHPKIEGSAFIIRMKGRWFVTPLFLALIFLEMSDIIFAVDSVPAIFSITKEPLIVFSSNIFAILGLRSMYFMLSGFMDRFSYIKYGLASVLIFVGLKMVYLNDLFDGKFPISWSLAIISVLIGSSVLASIMVKKSRIQ